MLLYDIKHVVGSNLDLPQRIVNVQNRTVQRLGGLAPCLLSHQLTSLGEHHDKDCHEDDRHEEHHPQTEAGGE